jgi:hypothetical protein
MVQGNLDDQRVRGASSPGFRLGFQKLAPFVDVSRGLTYLLVGVEGVNDQREKLVDLSLERKRFDLGHGNK